MAYFHSPRIVTDGLVLYLDAANSKLKKNALFYKWFVTNGTNPTTKAGFDDFFNVSPESSGIDEGREIDWIVVADRPTYITQTVNFAWEVSGFLIIDEPGTYIFNTRSDDGNELQINGQIVTSFYGGRGVPTPGDISSPITLNVGVYSFLYRMQQGAGGAGAQVRWQKPNSTSYEVIPSTNFAVGLDNNVFVDLSGNGNDGTLVNGPTFDSGNGGSLVFDGVNDYVGLGTSTSLVPPYVTVSLFVYLNSYSTRPHLFGRGEGSIGHFYFVVETSGVFRFYTDIGSGWSFIQPSSFTFPIGTWYNIVGTFDGSNVNVYGNGLLLATQSRVGQLRQYTAQETALGRILTSFNLNGNVAQVSIYNKALTAQEIQQNYNATKGRYNL